MFATEVIRLAYREAALRPIGFTPSPEELDEGLYRLNALVSGLFGAELGEVLTDWSVPMSQRTAPESSNNASLSFPANLSSFDQPGRPYDFGRDVSAYPPQNARLIARVTSPFTIWLPQFPDDGARMSWVDNGSTAPVTLNGNGRKIEGAYTVQGLPGGPPGTWFYRADQANWQLLEAMTLFNSTPLPPEFDDLFVTGLAIRLTALDEVAPKPGTTEAYSRILKRAQQRYKQRGAGTYGGQNLVNSYQSTDYEDGRRW